MNFPHAVQYITTPSDEIQILAVKQDSSSIDYITNPCRAALLEAEAVNNLSKILNNKKNGE